MGFLYLSTVYVLEYPPWDRDRDGKGTKYRTYLSTSRSSYMSVRERVVDFGLDEPASDELEL